jgi:hypothetical protein
MAMVGNRDHIFEVSKVYGPRIGGADRLSRDNRLDLLASWRYGRMDLPSKKRFRSFRGRSTAKTDDIDNASLASKHADIGMHAFDPSQRQPRRRGQTAQALEAT